ncbi:hypothetical protein FKM82_016576 [Ascaphus truei]
MWHTENLTCGGGVLRTLVLKGLNIEIPIYSRTVLLDPAMHFFTHSPSSMSMELLSGIHNTGSATVHVGQTNLGIQRIILSGTSCIDIFLLTIYMFLMWTIYSTLHYLLHDSTQLKKKKKKSYLRNHMK